MAKIALIAGGGNLPLEFVRSAKKQGDKVVAFALNGMASEQLEKEADKTYWMDIGQYKKFAFLLLKERIRRIALVGKVNKNVIYQEGDQDEEYTHALKKLKNKKDYSILKELTNRLGRIGIVVMDNMKYFSHLLAEEGILTGKEPSEETRKDIEFGYDTAKKVAGMDIGQTIIVKDQVVVAVEAMEGTDAAIKRASEIAGDGCVMIKVARPEQDMRWDVPTVGLETMKLLAEHKYKALVIESRKMYLAEKDEMLKLANSADITVEAL